MRALILIALALPAAAQVKTTCPLVLPRTTIDVKAPPGWIGYSPSIMRLTGFGMMAGPPESMTYLVPSQTKKLKGGSSSIWLFESSDEKWVYCTYDGGDSIQISRRLDFHATECTLAYTETERDGITEMTATCRSTPTAQPHR